MLAVEPGILGRRRLFLGCIGAALLTTAVLYLELPLRAGIFRAPLVYGHPETLSGFLYVVLGAQFAGSISGPLADLGGKLGDLVSVAGAQFGLLAWLIPVGLVVTIVRRPRYALLTIPSLLLTCWFAESYANAEIWRYFLGPALIAISWLAILAAEVVNLLEQAADRAPTGSYLWALGATVVDGVRERTTIVLEVVLVAALLVPTALALPARAWPSTGAATGLPPPGWPACCPSSIRTVWSSAGGVTPRRYGMHRTSRARSRTSGSSTIGPGSTKDWVASPT